MWKSPLARRAPREHFIVLKNCNLTMICRMESHAFTYSKLVPMKELLKLGKKSMPNSHKITKRMKIHRKTSIDMYSKVCSALLDGCETWVNVEFGLT